METDKSTEPLSRPAPAEKLPAAVANSSRTASKEQPPYTPQFSASTSLILNRIRKGYDGLGLAVSNAPLSIAKSHETSYSDARSHVVQKLGSTLSTTSDTLLLPPTPSTSTSFSISSHSAKRKRDDSVDKIDFTQKTIAFAPGSTATRMPPSTPLPQKHPVQDDPNQPRGSPRLRVKASGRSKEDIQKLRAKRLAMLPDGVEPAKPELVGFIAGQASDLMRTEYFFNKKKTDLLNILSFCDQLKPQLLVDIMVSVSKKHPDLPIFDSPDWEATISSNKSISTDERSRMSRILISSKAKPRPKRTKKILKRTRVIEVVTDAPEGEEELLPPTWPKANEGLYSKIAPDTEDRTYLLDDNDEESFSHFLVDKFGKQIIEPVGV